MPTVGQAVTVDTKKRFDRLFWTAKAQGRVKDGEEFITSLLDSFESKDGAA